MSILPVGEDPVPGRPAEILAIRRIPIFFDAYPMPSNVLDNMHTLPYIFLQTILQCRFL